MFMKIKNFLVHCISYKEIFKFLFIITFFSISFLAQAENISDIKNSAISGDVDAQLELGKLYASGKGVERDYEKAIHWYMESAKSGNASAQVILGTIYASGLLGAQKNMEKANHWWILAVKKGKASANIQALLADSYYYGNGIEKDIGKAVELYKKAASGR